MLNHPVLFGQIPLREALLKMASLAYTKSFAHSPQEQRKSAYSVIRRSAITECLADELGHPLFQLVVARAVGAHEAGDDERHGGLWGKYVCWKGEVMFSVAISIQMKLGEKDESGPVVSWVFVTKAALRLRLGTSHAWRGCAPLNDVDGTQGPRWGWGPSLCI